MKDKVFRLVQVRLLDAQTQKPIFEKPMWLGVWGKRRKEITGEEIYWAYRNRYDIEHFFRFGKQRLLLDKFQTPEEDHLQSWLEIVSLAYWLLYVAQEQANYETHKWQQYDENHQKRKEFGLKATPSQVQNQAQRIILGFEQTDFLPKLQIKGKGRKPGTILAKRPRYPVRIKGKNEKKEGD